MRVYGHHVPAAPLLLFLCETTVIGLAARLGWALANPSHPHARMPIVFALLLVGGIQTSFYLADLYDAEIAADDATSGERLLEAMGTLLLVSLPAVFAMDYAAHVPFALAASTIGAAALREAVPWQRMRKRLFVIGDGSHILALRKELERGATEAVVGVSDLKVPDLLYRIRASHAQVVVVASGRREVPSDLIVCRMAGLQVVEAHTYLERTRRKIPAPLLHPGALVYGPGFAPSPWARAGRRALSLSATLFLSILLLPLMAVLALLIRLDSPGPILYRQRRLGQGGREFIMWKFRTMREGAETETGPVWAQAQDPRTTRVGVWLRRVRLDEVPQFMNILRGDMDLVGPRPERPEFVKTLMQRLPFYDLRLLVKPGLTGWAQIRYPYGASIEEARQKLGYDLYYVKHASPVLDAIILFHTIKVVLCGRGAR